MEIQWHGLSCISIKAKNATILIDPYDSKEVGLKMPNIKTDVILLNIDNPLHAYEKNENQHVFNWPGEYEAKGVLVDIIPAYDRPREKEDAKKDQAQAVLMYILTFDDMRVAHVSNLGHKLTPEMLEKIGDIDILIVPIGGTSDGLSSLSSDKAVEVIEQIEPRVVIPMFFDAGQKPKLNSNTAFLKEEGLTNLQPEKVYKIAGNSSLPTDKTEYKLLEPVIG